MNHYLFKNTLFLLFGVLIVTVYYSFGGHSNSYSSGSLYPFLLVLSYFSYKYLSVNYGGSKLSFSISSLLLLFSLNLFLVCLHFFSSYGSVISSSIILFFKIIFLLSILFFLCFISYNFGEKVLLKLGILSEKNFIYNFVFSQTTGLIVFIFLLNMISFIGIYNKIGIIVVLIGMLGFSFNNFLENLSKIYKSKFITIDNHDLAGSYLKKINPYLLSTEFLFIVITFLISINLISVFRPMPIGWDDLGVYMNYPKLFAQNQGSMFLSGMHSWQIFTGVGYVFGSNVLAFFINNLGGIFSSIFMFLIFKDLLKTDKKTLINIPLFLSTIFMMMPMVIFQQAKDMKLDIGLYAFSIAGVYLLYKLLIANESNKETFKKHLIKIFSIGVIMGFCFSIKLTSLLTILSSLGVIFYSFLGLSGFFGFLSTFVFSFTYFDLWDRLYISYPKDNPDSIFIFTVLVFIFGLISFVFSFLRKKSITFKKLILTVLSFSFGILIFLLPFFAKNLYQEFSNNESPSITINSILWGRGEKISINSEYLDSLKDNYQEKDLDDRAIKNDGTSTNEDYGRYFGYEKGINNYLKLPYNLTNQVNQGGEFTDITYMYLVFLSLVLFLHYKNKKAYLLNLIFLSFVLLYYYIPTSSALFSSFFSLINLPLGFIVIFLFVLLPILFYIYFLDDSKLSNLFKLNIILGLLYILLWCLSSFGIVWYGILMYFVFLLSIGIGINYMVSYREDYSNKKILIKLTGLFSVSLFFLIYFFFSLLPNGLSNIKKSGFANYKIGSETQVEGIFNAHRNYLKIVSELNLGDNLDDFVLEELKNNYSENFIKIVSNYIDDFSDISQLNYLSTEISKAGDINLAKESRRFINAIYSQVLYPSDKYKNDKGVYRIGTFVKYFISDNVSRFYGDSLITNFDKYIYDDDKDFTVSRMKEIGLDYFLVDLNAATIDNDPRRDLTRRYENLLYTFTSDKLELIDTDSYCLKMAIDRLNRGEIDYQMYMVLAGVNYDSYMVDPSDQKEKMVPRKNKLNACYQIMFSLYGQNKIDEDNYSYLLNLKHYLDGQKDSFKNDSDVIKTISQVIGHGFYVLYKIK